MDADEIAERATAYAHLTDRRMIGETAEYEANSLCEAAVRALSPGINDPFTAMAVIDRLALSIQHVMQRGPAQKIWRDDNDRLRVIAPISTFDGIVDAAFHQIRQRAENSPDVLIRLAENLTTLWQQADAEKRKTLAEHIRLVIEAGRRSIPEPSDLQTLVARAEPVFPELAKRTNVRSGMA